MSIKNIAEYVTRSVEPAVEPITVDELKEHLRIESDFTADDTYLGIIISAARWSVEDFTGRTLIDTTFVFNYRAWSNRLYLQRGGVSSISSVKYRDSDGTLQTVATADYELSPLGDGEAECVMLSSFNEPTLYDEPVNNRIQVTAVAGYGEAGTDVPKPLVQGVYYMAAHLYDMRAPVIVGQSYEVPFTVDALIGRYKIYNP